MRVIPAFALAVLAFAAPQAALAQGLDTRFPIGTGTSPILTLDQEQLFEGSAFGQRVQAELERGARALAAENRQLEEDLIAEERALTERRTSLPPEEFRRLADAFDARVEEIRRTQEAKTRALAQFSEEERQRFFDLALPVLARLIVDSGAVVVLDSRTVFLAVDQIDITETAIARINAELGTGGGDGVNDLSVDAPAPDDLPGPPPALNGGPPLDLSDPTPLPE